MQYKQIQQYKNIQLNNIKTIYNEHKTHKTINTKGQYRPNTQTTFKNIQS